MVSKLGIHALCRICLQASDNLTSIYAEDDAEISTAVKIKQTTQIELKLLPNLPEQICESCLQDLDTAYRFRMNCETSEEILEQYMEAEEAAVEEADDKKHEFQVEYLEESDLKTHEEDLIIVEKPADTVVCYVPIKNEEAASAAKPGSKRTATQAWVCEICGANYKTKGEYKNHVKRHLGEKDFTCRYCPSTFVDRSSLARHTRKHTGEKPYACQFCALRFSDYTTVKRHMRTHTGEKPYQCKECNKSFALACVLQRHERAIHFGIKKYECNKCGKKFAQSHHLKQHNNVHLKEEGQPYTKYVRKKTKKPKIAVTEIVEQPISDEERTIVMHLTAVDEV